MKLRKVFFWLHLTAGSFAGLVILMMCVTGVLLMYQRQIVAWADRGFRAAPGPYAARLPVEALLARAQEQRSARPAAITVHSGPAAPAEVSFGTAGARYVDPYTGQVLGEGSRRIRNFFRITTEWHRYVAAQGDSRPMGRAITGACNLAFLFIVMSGFYLWWPREWARRQLRPVTWFRTGLAGKARDFNWHNVIGFWCAVPLFFVVLGAVFISYPAATNWLYRVTDSEVVPAAPAPPVPPGAAASGRPSLDELWARAEQQSPGWRTITLRLPASPQDPLTFTIDPGRGGQHQRRATLMLDAATGGVVRWEPYESLPVGRQLRLWLRFVHTGEAYGAAGQTIAGIASAGGVMLVWTGLSLALRRFAGWRTRRKASPQTQPEPDLVETATR